MSNEQALVSKDQREVTFYGDELVAIRASDDQIYVSVRHLSEALGLTRQSQVRRIERQPILSDGHFVGAMMTPKGEREANWLRVDLVPLFLTGIDTRRVKDEIRPKLELYQREASKVLWNAFQEGRLTMDTTFEDLLKSDSPAAQAYKLAQAMMQLARQQLLLEERVESKFANYDQRLEAIESQLGTPDSLITPSQAMQISQAVKAIAMELSKRSGRNEYGGVYGELYRKFEITGYKDLPANRFRKAMDWLTEWHQSLVGNIPF
jgi:hypothetical protein